jgi:hypothetical protein
MVVKRYENRSGTCCSKAKTEGEGLLSYFLISGKSDQSWFEFKSINRFYRNKLCDLLQVAYM